MKSHLTVLIVLLLALMMHMACKNPFTPKEKNFISIVDEAGIGLLSATEPKNVLNNLGIIYNFTQHGMDVERAIELYRDCFSNDVDGPQYEFHYKNVTGEVVGEITNVMYFAEEMSSTAALFREVGNKKLQLKLKEFKKIYSWDELAEDTVTQEIKHPGEDWYIYQMQAYMTMENPNPAENPYLVQGVGIFSVRRCADGKFRIVRWIDMTYESIQKTAAIVAPNATFQSICPIN
jgi:hypothetical protein